MSVFSIIKKSQLEGAKRLDAEYYQPEYLEVFKTILSLPHKSLKSYAEKIFSGPFGSTLKSESYQDVGVPFIRISDISDLFISKESLVYISPSEHKRIYSTRLNSGDIVLSKIGTVGKMSVISDELGEVNISENNIGIRLSNLAKEEKVALLFFLLGKYGQEQIVRKASGNIQLKLNVSDIESVQVPIFDKTVLNELSETYNNFLLKNTESQVLYSQAENLLLEELGLKDFAEEQSLYSVVNFSELKEANRMDAEYFQPKYEKTLAKIKLCNARPIGEISNLVGHSTQPSYSESGTIAVLAQKHMKRALEIEVSSFDNYTSKNLIKRTDQKFILEEGDVLISSAGEPGRTCVWMGSHKGEAIPGSFVTVVRLNAEVEPLYAGVFLNTLAGRLQFERDYTGSVQQYVYPSKIRNILIPILPKATQEEIANLVKQSHEARKKAKELLESAKRKVEEMIARV